MLRRFLFNLIIFFVIIMLIINYGMSGILIKIGRFLETSGKRIERMGKEIEKKEERIIDLFRFKEK